MTNEAKRVEEMVPLDDKLICELMCGLDTRDFDVAIESWITCRSVIEKAIKASDGLGLPSLGETLHGDPVTMPTIYDVDNMIKWIRQRRNEQLENNTRLIAELGWEEVPNLANMLKSGVLGLDTCVTLRIIHENESPPNPCGDLSKGHHHEECMRSRFKPK
jgi:hypothetical protein